MADDVTLLDLFDQHNLDIDDALGPASAGWLRHLCEGDEPLYLPYGYIDFYPPHDPAASPAVHIRADDGAGVSPHPTNPDQLILAAVVIEGEASVGARQWVSIAHLAHRNCPDCAHVWLQRAMEYDVCSRAAQDHTPADQFERWSLFLRTPTEDETAIVITHIGDVPQEGVTS